jgi:hypothetical protein
MHKRKRMLWLHMGHCREIEVQARTGYATATEGDVPYESRGAHPAQRMHCFVRHQLQVQLEVGPQIADV